MPVHNNLITLEEIKEAQGTVYKSSLGVVRTPLMKNCQDMFPSLKDVQLFIKMENTQTTGSFKLRGVANQMANLPDEILKGEKKLITMSAGNYGKAFAYALNKLQLPGLCLMPLTAPSSRVQLIKDYGVEVEQFDTSVLQCEVDKRVSGQGYIMLHSFDDSSLLRGYGRPLNLKIDEVGRCPFYMFINQNGHEKLLALQKSPKWTRESYGCSVEMHPTSELSYAVESHVHGLGNYLFHPFDDHALFAAYGSSALEVLEEGVTPDIAIVCCGGGGFVSGVAAALKLSGLKDCLIYAVEPQGSCTMYESFKQGKAVTIPTVKSVAAGLSPPFAGENTYAHCKQFVKDVVLVSDSELLNTMEIFYKRGIVVEPSGCAAMAALLYGHIPDVAGKNVLVYLTGGNVTPEEMVDHLKAKT